MAQFMINTSCKNINYVCSIRTRSRSTCQISPKTLLFRPYNTIPMSMPERIISASIKNINPIITPRSGADARSYNAIKPFPLRLFAFLTFSLVPYLVVLSLDKNMGCAIHKNQSRDSFFLYFVNCFRTIWNFKIPVFWILYFQNGELVFPWL